MIRSMSERISPIDASFAALDSPTTSQVFGGLGLLAGVPDPEDVAKRVGTLPARFPRLATRIGSSTPLRWIEAEKGGAESHLQIIKLPGTPGLAEFESAAAEEFSKPLEPDISPWKLTLLLPAESSGPSNHQLKSAFLFRFHHALADGLSGFRVLTALTEPSEAPDQSQRETHRDTPSEANIPPRPPFTRLGLEGTRALLRELFAQTGASFLHTTNSCIRRIVTIDFDLLALRRKKFQLGLSYNDLVLEIATNALRRYAQKVRVAPTDIRALVPVSLRRLEARSTLGNHLTGVVIRLPASVSDQTERLKLLDAESAILRSSGALAAYNLLAEINSRLPLSIQRRATSHFARRTDLICTNPAYASRRRALGGATLKSIYGLPALMNGQALALAFVSYAGRTCVSTVLDASSDIDGELFRKSLQTSYDELIANSDLAKTNAAAPSQGSRRLNRSSPRSTSSLGGPNENLAND